MKVSVVTPSFNHAHFIVDTIESVLAQDYSDIEYIVVDGLSSDNTVNILKKYSDRIKWISEVDTGQTEAINKGLKMASGEIVCFLNSDDLFEKNTISQVVQTFRLNPDVKWVYGKCRIVDANNSEIRHLITLYKNIISKRFSYRKLLVENFISQPATFWKSELHSEFGYLDESEHFAMDYEFWCRIGAKHKPTVINSYLSRFRMYPTSKSGSLTNPVFEDELRIAKKYSDNSFMLMSLHRLNIFKIETTYFLMTIYKRSLNKIRCLFR